MRKLACLLLFPYMFLAVYGEDALRVRECAEDLREKFVAKYDPARLNVEQIDFATASKETIIPLLTAAPFLAEKRFVFLKNVADTLKKPDVPFWTEVFSHLDAATSLCFVDDLSETSWKKSHLGTWLAAYSSDEIKVYPLTPFTREERVAWICARAQRLGVVFSDRFAEMLISRVGNESHELVLELHKLCTYAQKDEITQEMIERLIPLRASSDFFGFLDLLPKAEPEDIVRALKKEIDAGADPFGMVGGLLRQLRILRNVALLHAQGVTSSSDIARSLDLHPFVAQKAVQAVKCFSFDRLEGAFSAALLWERRAKAGVSPEIIMHRLLVSLLLAREKRIA